MLSLSTSKNGRKRVFEDIYSTNKSNEEIARSIVEKIAKRIQEDDLYQKVLDCVESYSNLNEGDLLKFKYECEVSHRV
jgi:hypothetical protein